MVHQLLNSSSNSQEFSAVRPEHLLVVADRFVSRHDILKIQPVNTGLINDTFCVFTKCPQQPKFILQRINTSLFPHPEQIAENLVIIIEHIGKRLQDEAFFRGDNLRIPRLLPATDGDYLVRDEYNHTWRALEFIANSISLQDIDPAQGRAVGAGLGCFHTLLADLDPARLHDTLPGFHVTPDYLQHYDRTANQSEKSPEAEFCRRIINTHRDHGAILEDARDAGQLSIRVIHGDPKLNNILFNQEKTAVVSLIDLDTVKPGLLHYDIGDCLRSCCRKVQNRLPGKQEIIFDMEIFSAFMQGYIPRVKHFFTNEDYRLIYHAVQLIPFELGLRFFTDFLEGNIYFKVKAPHENLHRAMIQFILMEDIIVKKNAIHQAVIAARMKC